MKKPVVICVDDESIILDALTEQLSRNLSSDYNIEVAESGEEALELFADLLEEGIQVPIVISDYIMPEMKGDELLKKVGVISPNTLTILLTGQASIEGVGNAINNGNLYRFISKPWDQNDLALTVNEAIKSFDKTNQIKRYTTELEDLNKSLESKVEERTKELQELNATKDKFFSIIAHDLKNPFNYLIGMTGILTEYMDSMEPEEVKELLEKLQESAKNAFNLLQNLLDWARSQRDAITMNEQSHDLNVLVSNSLTPIIDLALEKDIAMSNNINNETNVFVDEYMVSTIIRNLVSNAIKYTRNNGNIKLDAFVNGDMVTVSVNDSGLGMDETTVSNLFKIDEGISTKGTNDEIGTGLGLILCQEFVAKHKGEIWAESEEGVGSTFYFTIPFSKD